MILTCPSLSVDPETRAEWEEHQKNNPVNAVVGGMTGQQTQSPLGDFDLASYLSGSDKNNGGGKKGKK